MFIKSEKHLNFSDLSEEYEDFIKNILQNLEKYYKMQMFNIVINFKKI